MKLIDPSKPFPADLGSIPVDLHEDALLYLINALIFHPRGYMLTVDYDPAGKPSWTLHGHGAEPFRYAFTDAELDQQFALVNAALARAQREGDSEAAGDVFTGLAEALATGEPDKVPIHVGIRGRQYKVQLTRVDEAPART